MRRLRLRLPLRRVGGRALLWAGLLLLLARGALSVVSPPRPAPRPLRSEPAAVWPDARATAFAVGFARAYFSPQVAAEGSSAGLARYLTPALAAAGKPLVAGGTGLGALQATPSGSASLGPRRALVTVRVDLAGAPSGVRYLSIPVAASPEGALAVDDYPSLAPGPPRARTLTAPALAQLEPGLAAEVRPLLARFFALYLGGSTAELGYVTSPGLHLQALDAPCDRVQVVELASLAPPSSTRLVVHATVRARDRTTGASVLLAYLVGLERQGRWYVATVNAAERTQP